MHTHPGAEASIGMLAGLTWLLPEAAQAGLEVALNLLEVVLVAHALHVVWQTGAGDLVAGEGVDCIKVCNELSAPAFAAVAAAAARHRLPLLGHVPHGVGLAALADGFEVQHMTGLPYLHRPRAGRP